MYTTDVYKIYTKYIPHFNKLLHTFLYTKLKELWQLNFVYKMYTKFVEMWDTFCIQFAYILYNINSDLQKVYITKTVYNLYTKFIQNVYK